jgi:hypothetical protein
MNRARIIRLIALPATVLLIAGGGAATASRIAHTANSPAAQVRAAELTLFRALAAHNTHAAGRLFARDFQLIDVTGTAETRAEYLTNIGGQIDIVKFEPVSPIRVRMHGSSAVARVKLHVKVIVGGQTTEGGAWNTDLLERRHGRWLVVWAQTTAIPNNIGLFVESLKTQS